MKEFYKEDLANHFGIELYADGRNIMGVATAEVDAGKLLSSENTRTECRHCLPIFAVGCLIEHKRFPGL
jgi:hypothetical protein